MNGSFTSRLRCSGRALAVFVVVACGAARATGADSAPLPTVARILPARTLAVAIVENVSGTLDSLRNTAPAELWREGDVQACLGPAARALVDVVRTRAARVAGLDLADLSAAFRSQVALAVVDLQPAAAGRPAASELALLAEVSDRAAAERLLDRALRALRETAGVEARSWSIGGLAFAQASLGREIELGYVLSDEALYAAVGRRGELLKELLRAASGDGGESLASQPSFVSAGRRFGTRRDVFAFVNVGRLAEAAVEAMRREATGDAKLAARLLDALGLTDVRGVALACSVEPPGIRAELFVHAPAPRRGLFTLLPEAPLGSRLLDLAPPGSRGIAAWRFEPGALVPLARAVMTVFDPRAGERFDEEVAGLGRALAVDIDGQVLRGLGGEGALVLPEGTFLLPSPSIAATAGLAHAVVAVRVENPDGFRPVYDRLTALGLALVRDAGFEPASELRPDGVRISYAKLPLGFSPAVAMTNELILAGPTVEGVRRALDRKSAGGRVLRGAPSYTAASALVRGQAGFLHVYLAPTRVEELAPVMAALPPYLAGLYAASAGAGEGANEARRVLAMIDLAQFVPAETVARHAQPAVLVGWCDDDGVALAAWGCGVGALDLVALGAAAGAAIDSARANSPHAGGLAPAAGTQ